MTMTYTTLAWRTSHGKAHATKKYRLITMAIPSYMRYNSASRGKNWSCCDEAWSETVKVTYLNKC